MSEYLVAALSLLAGFLLGGFFFGGLWWTVRSLLTSQRPALWLFASMVTRVSVTLTGFYFTGGTEWKRWLACLIGFVVARGVINRLSRATKAGTIDQTRKARYAP